MIAEKKRPAKDLQRIIKKTQQPATDRHQEKTSIGGSIGGPKSKRGRSKKTLASRSKATYHYARGLAAAEAKALVLSTYGEKTGIGTSRDGSFEVGCKLAGTGGMKMRVTCTDVHVAALVYNTFKGKGKHGVKAKAATQDLDYDGLKHTAAALVASAWARVEADTTTAQEKATLRAARAQSEAAMAWAL